MKPFAPTQRGRKAEYRPARDNGSDQLVLRRILAVGPKADPALAATPLGIMEARELITLDERAAGERYRSMYATASNLARWFALDPSWAGDDPETLERTTRQFTALRSHLQHMGLNVLGQVHSVAVYQQTPVWMSFALTKPHKDVWRVVVHHRDFSDLHNGLKDIHKMLQRMR